MWISVTVICGASSLHDFEGNMWRVGSLASVEMPKADR
jgi:hypothetical protein